VVIRADPDFVVPDQAGKRDYHWGREIVGEKLENITNVSVGDGTVALRNLNVSEGGMRIELRKRGRGVDFECDGDGALNGAMMDVECKRNVVVCRNNSVRKHHVR
jgi:hypothetical protein